MSSRALSASTAFSVSSYQRCVSLIMAKRTVCLPRQAASMRAMFLDILLSAYVCVVGVVFDMVAACGEQRKQEQTGS